MPSPRELVATPYRAGVLVLALTTLVWRGWTVSRWTWQDDDFVFIGRAVSMPLWQYLVQDYNGHFMPGGFLVTRILVGLAPFDFTLVVVLVAVTSAANVILWGLALARVTRNHVGALLPLAVLALSPVILQPMMWWAVSVGALPLQLCLAGMVIVAVEYAETRRTKQLVRLALVFALGLFFWQKCVFLTIPVAFVLVGSARGNALTRLRRVWPALLVLLGMAVPYLSFYLYWTRGMSTGNSVETSFEGYTPAGVVSDYVRAFEQVVFPSLLGGPWGTLRVGSDAYSTQSAPVTNLVLLVVTILAVLVVARNWRASWLLTLPVLYSVTTLGLVLFSTRKQDVWDVMVTERYHVDGIVVAMVAVALVLRETTPDPASLSPRGVRAIVAMGTALAVSLTVANVVQANRVGVRGSQQWVDNVRAELLAPPPGYGPDRPLVALDTFAPTHVLALAPTWGRYGSLSGMLSPFSSVLRFNEPTEQLWIITPEDGRLVPAVVEELAAARPGRVEGCGHLLRPGETVSLRMSNPLFFWGWGVTISTFSDRPSDLVVTIADTEVPVSLPTGPQERTFQYDGPVPSTVKVTSSTSSGLVCLTGLSAGSIVPGA